MIQGLMGKECQSVKLTTSFELAQGLSRNPPVDLRDRTERDTDFYFFYLKTGKEIEAQSTRLNLSASGEAVCRTPATNVRQGMSVIF